MSEKIFASVADRAFFASMARYDLLGPQSLSGDNAKPFILNHQKPLLADLIDEKIEDLEDTIQQQKEVIKQLNRKLKDARKNFEKILNSEYDNLPKVDSISYSTRTPFKCSFSQRIMK